MSSYHGCLRLTPLFWFAVAVGGPCIAGSEVVLWDGQEDPAVWTETRGLSLSRDAEALVLDIEQPDSWLRRADLDIDPADVAWIHIRYRARGFEAQSTSGEVFYANAHHAFADESYIRLPSLILDDRWHDMWVEVARSMRGDYWDFALGGQITALRLDLVNQAPGTVELAQVRLLRNRPPRRVSPMGQTLSGWADPKGLRMTQDEDGLLHLEVQEPDGWVTLDGLSLDPAAARYFVIRYRATGFADEPTTGQVFYANDRHDIVGDWKVPLSSLTTDGQWHDLVVDAWAAMGTGHVDWLYGGTVHKLRLDLVDQAPGTVDIADVFVCPGCRPPRSRTWPSQLRAICSRPRASRAQGHIHAVSRFLKAPTCCTPEWWTAPPGAGCCAPFPHRALRRFPRRWETPAAGRGCPWPSVAVAG